MVSGRGLVGRWPRTWPSCVAACSRGEQGGHVCRAGVGTATRGGSSDRLYGRLVCAQCGTTNDATAVQHHGVPPFHDSRSRVHGLNTLSPSRPPAPPAAPLPRLDPPPHRCTPQADAARVAEELNDAFFQEGLSANKASPVTPHLVSVQCREEWEEVSPARAGCGPAVTVANCVGHWRRRTKH